MKTLSTANRAVRLTFALVTMTMILLVMNNDLFAMGAPWSVQGNSLSTGDFLGSTNAEDVVIKSNNAESMRISTDGDLFLLNGYTGFQLCASTVSIPRFFAYRNSGGDMIRTEVATGDNRWEFTRSGCKQGSIFFESGLHDMNLKVNSGDMTFVAGNNERFRINRTGSDGISVSTRGTGSNFTESGIAFRVGLSSNPDYHAARIYAKHDGTGVADGRLSFQVKDGFNNFVDALSIKGGKVGIGMNNPAEALDVNGNLHVSDKVLASAYSSNSPLIFEAPVGTERARIDDITGNFGIGTNAPSARLEALHSDLGAGANVLMLTNEGVGTSFTETGIAFNVAVGTNPSFNSARIYSKYDGTAVYESRLTFQMRGNGFNYYDVLSIVGTQDVGIGTTSPLARLDVRKTGDGASLLRLSSERAWEFRQKGNGAATELELHSIVGEKSFRITSKNDVTAARFFTSEVGNDRVILVPDAGRVGIGTDSPQGLLDINGGGSAREALFVKADPSTPNQGGVIHHQGSTYAWQEVAQGTGSATGGVLRYHYVNRSSPGTKQAANVFVLYANGNADLCGRLRATEVLVDNTWCDYVFEEDYELRSLDEVEEFIRDNKRLPNIPPASEIEANGMPVAEMSRKMMEKIEELTLYVIQQQKQIASLEQKMAEMSGTKGE